MSDNRSNLEHLLSSKRPPAPADDRGPAVDEDDVEYTAFTFGRIGRRTQMMIAFVRCSGEVESFPYASLSRMSTSNPEKGFTLLFGQVTVRVEGERLARLWRYLGEQRVAEVREADRTDCFTRENGGLVTHLEVAAPAIETQR